MMLEKSRAGNMGGAGKGCFRKILALIAVCSRHQSLVAAVDGSVRIQFEQYRLPTSLVSLLALIELHPNGVPWRMRWSALTALPRPRRNCRREHSLATASFAAPHVGVSSMNGPTSPFNFLEFPTDIVLLVVLWRVRYKLGFFA